MIRYIQKRWLENLGMFLIIFVGGALKVVAAYCMGSAFNFLIKSNFDEFVRYVVFTGVAYLFYLGCLYIKVPYRAYVTQKMITDIRVNISESIGKNDFKTFYKKNTGNYISWLSNDLMIVEQKGFTNFYHIATFSIETLLAILGLLAFHWSIILFAVVMSFVTLFLPTLVQKTIEKRSGIYSKSLEDFVSKNTNSLQGFDVLMSFNKLAVLKNIVFNTSNDILKKNVNMNKGMALGTLLGFTGTLISQVGLLALTGFLAIKNIVGFGSILTIESLASTIFNSVGSIMNLTIELKTVKPLFAKFDEFIKDSEQIDNARKDKKLFTEDITTIKLENLVYNYDDKSIFNGLTYSFNKGNKYAVVGASGSGKSTLLKILTGRLDDYAGNIYINNSELKDINIVSLYDKIMYISQEPYIFTDSLKFNITLGDDISDDLVLSVLEKVGLSDVVNSLDNGINTVLDEGGRNLSGGQKQRVSLARGLIRNKNILFLDEITSSQDTDNASQIEELVLNDPNLTVIMITHQLTDRNRAKFDDILEITA